MCTLGVLASGQLPPEASDLSVLAEHGAVVLGREHLHVRRTNFSGHHCVGDMEETLVGMGQGASEYNS